MRANLRFRVALGTALVAMTIVLINSAMLLYGFEKLEDRFIESLVGEQLQSFIADHRSDPTRTRVSENRTAYVASTASERAQWPSYLRDLQAGVHEVVVGDQEYRVVVREEPDGRYLMVYDTTSHDEREVNFLYFLGLGLAVTIVAAGSLGRWAAGKLVRPVHELARRVGGLAAEPGAAPIAGDYSDEEVRRLAQAIDSYRKKVADSIEREREFTANVSHELRTPLTAIRTSCELLLQERRLNAVDRRRVESIDRAAERLTATARSLLFLARGGVAPSVEDVSIRECVEEAAEPIRALLLQKGVAFDLAVHSSAVVSADRTALYLVASNLLRNAALYTDRGHVRAVYVDGCLIIEDSGRGIDADTLEQMFVRFQRGPSAASAEGWGLGLSIVKRICDAFGWSLEIASTPGSGTRVTVRLPVPTSRDFHETLTSL